MARRAAMARGYSGPLEGLPGTPQFGRAESASRLAVRVRAQAIAPGPRRPRAGPIRGRGP